MVVERHNHSKNTTIAVTKAVLRKNHRKQTCKQLPVLGKNEERHSHIIKKNNSRY